MNNAAFREKLATHIANIQSALTQLSRSPLDPTRLKELMASLLDDANEAARMMSKWEEEAKKRGE